VADFQIAYKKSLLHEGLYPDEPYDHGGETYMGISKRSHPKWTGWVIIDAYKSQNLPKKDFLRLIKTDTRLHKLVEQVYEKDYWKVIRGDEIKHQIVADSIFDSAVNMGCVQALKLAQRAIQLPDTGEMNDVTLNKLNV